MKPKCVVHERERRGEGGRGQRKKERERDWEETITTYIMIWIYFKIYFICIPKKLPFKIYLQQQHNMWQGSFYLETIDTFAYAWTNLKIKIYIVLKTFKVTRLTGAEFYLHLVLCRHEGQAPGVCLYSAQTYLQPRHHGDWTCANLGTELPLTHTTSQQAISPTCNAVNTQVHMDRVEFGYPDFLHSVFSPNAGILT